MGAGGWRASHQSAFVSTGVVRLAVAQRIDRRETVEPAIGDSRECGAHRTDAGNRSRLAKPGRNSYELGAVSLDATHMRCAHASGLVARPPYPFGTRTHVARAQNWACFPLLHVVDCTKEFDNLSSV